MLNTTTLQGRFTKDPELRHTQSGTAVASFTLAWSEKRGEQENKLFLPCTAWGARAEFICRNFHKGDQTIAEGKLTSREWTDRNGNNRVSIEMTVEEVHFCGKRTTESIHPAETDGIYPADDFEDGDFPF